MDEASEARALMGLAPKLGAVLEQDRNRREGRKKFLPGEYVVTNTGGGDRLAVVVNDWRTTLAHEIRLDFPGGGSRLDRPQDACRLASEREIEAGSV